VSLNANLWTQLLIAIVPAFITGIGSLFVALKKCKSEIKTLEVNNRHEIEKLMKQHEIDIENLKEKYDAVLLSFGANVSSKMNIERRKPTSEYMEVMNF